VLPEARTNEVTGMVGHCFPLCPECSRERASENSAKAEDIRQDLRQKRKLLRVAEEYERLADRAARWRMGLPKLVAKGR
jgi:hypothetical protein